MRQKFIKLGFLCGVSLFSIVETASCETIYETLHSTKENHPSIHAMQAGEGIALGTVKEEEAKKYPFLNLGASFGRVYSNTTTTRGLSTSRGAGYSWFGEGRGQLTQKIYDWSSTDHSIKASQNRYQSALAETQSQMASISLEAIKAYLQLLRATTLLDLAKENEKNMGTFYGRIKSAYDNGGVDESEVSRSQDIVSMAKNIVLQYDGEYKIAQANYKDAVGRLPIGDIEEPELPLSLIPQTIEDARSLALSLNAQVKSFDYSESASRNDYQSERAAQKPTIDFELSANKRDQKDIIGGESEDVRGLVRANWDYSFGGAGKAAQERALYSVKEAQYRKEALQRSLERDIEVAWVSLNMATQKKENEEIRFGAAQKTLETYKEQYEGGQQKMLDVMTVQNAEFLAKQDYLNMKYQEMNAVYTLLNVIGLPISESEASKGDVMVNAQ